MMYYRETARMPLAGSTPSVNTKLEAVEVVKEYKDPTSDLSQSEWGRSYAASRPPDGEHEPCESDTYSAADAKAAKKAAEKRESDDDSSRSG
jgi:MHS family proline/betaine transporter-like MFS transporter